MQSALSEITLRSLASNLGKEYKTLATHLGVRRDEVDRIRADYLDSEEQIFQILMTWWQRWDHHTNSKDSDALFFLCEALVKSGRMDLAEFVRGPAESVRGFNLEVCRDEFIRYYKDTMSVVPLLPWLPSEVSKIEDMFVELKLMENRGKGKAAMVVERDIASYEDMLRLKLLDDTPVRYVLVCGIAGSGKTTIVSRIALDWALEKPDSPLSKFQLLVALNMREINTASDLTEAIYDQILPKDTKVCRNSLRNYLSSHAKEILVVLDGADEAGKDGTQLPAEGDVIDIISNKILRGSTVIVTTRPHMVDKLCKLNPGFTRIDSNGFSEESIKEYIQRFFRGENPEVSTKLHRYLLEHESLYDLSRTPMMLLLVCLVWSENNALPATLTELFKEAIFFMLRRYFQKSDQFDHEDEKLLTTELSELIQGLGKAALNGLMTPGQKLIFEATDVGSADAIKKACEIGILSQERVRSKLRAVQNVTFFHKTFQEALGGLYWAALADSDKECFKRYLSQVNRKNVLSLEHLLRFCCGANVQAAKSLLIHVVDTFSRQGSGRFYSNGYWHVYQPTPEFNRLCLLMHLEAQSTDVHSALAPLFEKSLLFNMKCREDILLAFAFLIQCATKSSVHQSFLTELRDVTFLSINKHVPLIIDIFRHATNVTDALLEFEAVTNDKLNDIEASLQSSLGDVLHELPMLTSLSLSGKSGTAMNLSTMFEHLAQSVTLRCLQRLALNRINIDPICLQKFIQKQSKIRQLDLRNFTAQLSGSNDVVSESDVYGSDNDDGAAGVEDVQMQSLQSLSMKCYKTDFLKSCFRWSCPNLQVLNLIEGGLQEDDFKRVSILLSKVPQLQVLDLSCNEIGNAFPGLGEQLKALRNLQVLILKQMGLHSDQVVVLVHDILPSLENLQTFSITHNDSLSSEDLLSVVQWSCNVSSLKSLHLQKCVKAKPDKDTLDLAEVESESVSLTVPLPIAHQSSVESLNMRLNVLGKCTGRFLRLLKQMPALKILDVSCMGFVDSNAVQISEVLPACQQLQELYLHENDNLGNAGIEALLKMLPKLPNLRHLEMPVISDKPTDMIQECLKHQLPYSSECLFKRPDIENVIKTIKRLTADT